MSHFVIYLVFITKKWGMCQDDTPPEMVDNNLVSLLSYF
jgi:hypothetical protein